MTCPPELNDPSTFPELGVAVQVNVVKSSEAARDMLVIVLEQIVEFAALVTDGLGLTVTL